MQGSQSAKTGKRTKSAAARADDRAGAPSRPRAVQGGAMPGSAGNHGILLLARMAQLVDAEERRDSKKRKTAAAGGSGVGAAQGAEDGGERGAGGSGAENADREVIWRYLTPSDLRLTPEALISTKVSHFRCNLNGCPRDYRSHTALARHRKEKHLEWSEHEYHSANEECSLQAECKEGHCGGEHKCSSEEACVGAMPHCHEGMQWPPEKGSVFQCPAGECKYAAGHVQSLRYHYLRTHGDQERFSCEHCGKTFALKSDLNRHVTSCVLGFMCDCGKLLRTAEGLETHRRIFHRDDGGRVGAALNEVAAHGKVEEEGMASSHSGAGVAVGSGGAGCSQSAQEPATAQAAGRGHVDAAGTGADESAVGADAAGANTARSCCHVGSCSHGKDAPQVNADTQKQSADKPSSTPGCCAGGYCERHQPVHALIRL